jgi:hypothetical protein
MGSESAQASAWREFLRGLTQPSLPALLLTLLVPTAGFALCSFGITPAFLARNAGLLAIDPQDTDLFAISRATRLHLESSTAPTLFLIGSSTLLRSVPDPAELERAFGSAVGQSVPVVDLACEGSTVVQMENLVSLLPARLEGLFVIEVTPRQLATFANDDEVRAVNWDPAQGPGTFFWHNKRFFLPRLASIPRNLLYGRLEYAPEEYLTHRMTESGWQIAAAKMKSGIGKNYAAEREQSYASLAEVVARLRAGGKVQVALLEPPLSERGYREVLGPAFWDEHRSRLRRFADEQGLELWRLDEEAALEEEDFADFMHLYRAESQARYTHALARHAAELWRRRS